MATHTQTDPRYGWVLVAGGMLSIAFQATIFFAVEGDAVVVLTVLPTSRDPAEWQRSRPDRGT